MLMAHCKELGVKQVVQDSSGNAGNSIAAYLAQQDRGNTLEDCLITMCGAGLKSDH